MILKCDLVRFSLLDPKRIDPELVTSTSGVDRIQLLLNPRQKMLIACAVHSHLTIAHRMTACS